MKIKIHFLDFSRFSWCSVLGQLIEATYLATIFLIPLWFAYFFPTYNIFELNKMLLFKSLVWLLLLFTSLKLIFYSSHLNQKPQNFFKKYWLWPTVFIIGLSFNLLSSLNPALSFFGITERQAGLSSYLFYFLWFILVSFNVAVFGRKAINRIIVTIFVSGSLVALYGILQILNIDFLSWPEPPYLTQRAFSSLGQPNFLASWLLLVIPLGVYLVYKSQIWYWKFISGLLTAAQLICLFLTGSRGGLIAGLAAAAFFLIYALASLTRLRSWPRRKKILISVSFLILAFLSLVGLNYASSGRVQELLDYKAGSSGARLNFYTASADAIKGRPILGYGLETGSEIFIRYYQPDWGVSGDVAQTADRAHNLVLDILLTTGAFGLILFIIIYYFFFSLAKNNIRQQKQPALSLALALGAIGYLISLMFSFAIVSGEIYFWLFMALLVAICASSDYSKPSTGGSRHFSPLLKIIITVILVIFVSWQVSRIFSTLIADFYFNKIYYLLVDRDYPTALVIGSYLPAQKVNPILRESYDLSRADKMADDYQSIEELVTKIAVRENLQELDQVLPPAGYRNLLVKAKINYVLENFSVAQEYLTQLVAITPHWPPAYLVQGELSAATGKWSEAIIAYHLAKLNLPAENNPYLNNLHRQTVRNYQYFIARQTAVIYLKQKNYGAAEKYYQEAYRSNPNDFVLLKNIADTYYLRGDLATAVEYNKRGAIRSPKDYHWFLALAILYQEMGDKKQADVFYDQASNLIPAGQKLEAYKIEEK
jgi:putative inorganic carbon (HCO3(-)) transporter